MSYILYREFAFVKDFWPDRVLSFAIGFRYRKRITFLIFRKMRPFRPECFKALKNTAGSGIFPAPPAQVVQ